MRDLIEPEPASGAAAPTLIGATYRVVAFLLLVLLAVWGLTSWPATWFDEGSHLMVPKALVRFGVYADFDSTGFRYFGATLGVGPTVLVPIAGIFKVFGVGLLQARLVMATYLVLAVVAFHALAKHLGGSAVALIAAMLLVISPGLGTLEFGRQVLGEVPGLFFLCFGLRVLISGIDQGRPTRSLIAGFLLGLAAITKYQYLGVVMLGLGVAWLILLWRDRSPFWSLLAAAAVAGVVFGAWQVCLLGYLGPSSFAENVRYVRDAAAGAALAFSVERMLASGRLLMEPGMLLGALVPSVAYGTTRAVRRGESSSAWPIVMGFVIAALSWFVVASIGWRRYAYPGVALASIPAAALLVDGLGLFSSTRHDTTGVALRWTAACWLAAMVALPLPVVVPRIASRGTRDAQAMAAILNRDVPRDATIATWEPEMTFLTDHRYRVPPQRLLAVAVAHVWAAGPSPAAKYDFEAGGPPDYVLVGPFARGVGVYPDDRLGAGFEPIASQGPYTLHRRKP